MPTDNPDSQTLPVTSAEETASSVSEEELTVKEEAPVPTDPQPLPKETTQAVTDTPSPVVPEPTEEAPHAPDLTVVREALIRTANVPQALVPLLPTDLVALAEYLNSADYLSVTASLSKPVPPAGKTAEQPEVKVAKPTGPDLASIGRALFGA